MHADHIMGIVPLLRNILWPPQVTMGVFEDEEKTEPRIEIFGPAGLRLFIRQIMKMTFTRTADKYVVHELLTSTDPITPCEPRPAASTDPNTHSPIDFHIAEPNIMHASELRGRDIRPFEDGGDGCWHRITEGKGYYSTISVSAGPILHRDPCIGYTFLETSLPHRKLVILGDTCDPSGIAPLCYNPSPSLLVHEATDSCISPSADALGRLSKRSAQEVTGKALERGHSTPEMAGSFAKMVGAKALILNHIGGRFPAPRTPQDTTRSNIMRDIEKKATYAWGAPQGKLAVAAYDYLRVYVPIPDMNEYEVDQGSGEGDMEIDTEVDVEVVDMARVAAADNSKGKGRDWKNQDDQGEPSGSARGGHSRGHGNSRGRGAHGHGHDKDKEGGNPHRSERTHHRGRGRDSSMSGSSRGHARGSGRGHGHGHGHKHDKDKDRDHERVGDDGHHHHRRGRDDGHHRSHRDNRERGGRGHKDSGASPGRERRHETSSEHGKPE
ncbi:hypothetical protein D9613_004287 [Agrocybe pediades]|uniref:Uncharacterized protein n=1 Tax=Agrocybe pediades TaxID=84607 RepID=A0A8H4VL41_9AGAR|nr:hypothetical protein D9613_004287 [Agrocybe pediades]